MSAFRLQPYRLFFPLGVMGGVLGVGAWVLWTAGVKVPNVSFLHATLQSEGFLASFVVGFLLTAFPRFAGAPPAAGGGIALVFSSAIAFYGFALAGRMAVAETAFLVMITSLLLTLAKALPYRTKPLPEPFVLIGFALLHAIAGPALILWSRFGERSFNAYFIGRQMIQVGFLSCAVLGVVGKLGPFLMGYSDESPDKSVNPNRVWARVAHATTGAALILTFVFEPYFPQSSLGLRAAIIVAHLATFGRVFRTVRHKGIANRIFALSTWLVAAGYCLAALFPGYRIAALHVVFIGGFSLMIFSFGSVIVLTHGARADELKGRMMFLRIAGGLVGTGLLLRLAADFDADHYMALLHSAGGFWVAGSVVWLVHLWKPPVTR